MESIIKGCCFFFKGKQVDVVQWETYFLKWKFFDGKVFPLQVFLILISWENFNQVLVVGTNGIFNIADKVSLFCMKEKASHLRF